eukprot:457465-Ditylum_brightwellii.AAC.1
MTELMMCVAFSLRLYLLGGAAGIIGASLITGTSISSLSHGINAGWQDGIGFVETGSLVVTIIPSVAAVLLLCSLVGHQLVHCGLHWSIPLPPLKSFCRSDRWHFCAM